MYAVNVRCLEGVDLDALNIQSAQRQSERAR
jgi:hypothetical protein